MKKKLFLLVAISAIFVGCSNANTQNGTAFVPNQYEDPYKLMEAKREYYAKLDKQKMLEEKAKVEAQQQKEAAKQVVAEEAAKGEEVVVEKSKEAKMEEFLRIMEKKRKGL